MTRLLNDVIQAAQILRSGGTVAFPTETVFGLGARFDSLDAVAKIFTAKGRPTDNPLIVHCATLEEMLPLCEEFTESARCVLMNFAPGPVTVVLRRSSLVPDQVSCGLSTVAMRIPDHLLARQLIAAVGVPLVAPSANRSGRPSPTTWQAVWEDLENRIDGVLVGEPTRIGLESTVIDCSESPPRLLRSGAVSAEELQRILPDLVDKPPTAEQAKRSPGLRHRHYAPHAKVNLFNNLEEVTPSSQVARLWIENSQIPQVSETANNETSFGLDRRYVSVEQYAHDLFEALRQADRLGLQAVYCQRISTTGLGRALMDRLQRASE